jgi:sulfite oxidase
VAAVSEEGGSITKASMELRSPGHGSHKQITDEPIALQGYAYSGGGREIIRVDVSLDGGKTWDQAELLGDCNADSTGGSSCSGNKHWAWKRWRYAGQLPAVLLTPEIPSGDGRCTTVVVKATDDAYNTQPESHSSIYNVRGNLATAWHRVRVCPKCVGNGNGNGVTWSTGQIYGCGFNGEVDKVTDKFGEG